MGQARGAVACKSRGYGARQIAVVRSGVRDGDQIGNRFYLAQFFKVSEEEGFIFFDGAAQSAAELVSTEGRGLRAFEEIARIQSAVAQIFKSRPVETVRSRFAGCIHHRAGA